eukprot:gb/GECH01001265.1/.p1 GENE.gb/GECH01001265.1/~~gb/GECH01001265.1/.p1  ORF type:complete len:878 (+),score=203.99 gb/GECH01001265.1/:1-2634(+)
MSGIDFMSVIERLQAQENKASQELEKIYQENITEINKRSDNLHNIQSKLDATSKETQKLNTAINKTSLMLEDVTHKIRSLHSAKINAKSALSLVNGLIDIKKSVEGIDDALLKEDYESAASCVERVLKLGLFAMQDVEEEEQQQHQHHYYAGSSSSSGNVSINALRERVEKTRSAVKHEFQSCIDHKNTHGIQRYARLFKGLGIADEGAEMFALYLTNGAWKSLYRYVEENLRLLKDISTSSSYDSIITPIFDQLAAVVETEEATCEEFFGRGSFLNVVDSIAAAADTLAGRVLQHFVTHRNIDHMKSSVFNELDEERMNLSFLRSRDNKKLLSKNNNNNNKAKKHHHHRSRHGNKYSNSSRNNNNENETNIDELLEQSSTEESSSPKSQLTFISRDDQSFGDFPIALGEVEDKGRCVVAQHHLEPGETVLAETAVGWAPLGDKNTCYLCHYCSRVSPIQLPCVVTEQQQHGSSEETIPFYYCSSKCKQQAEPKRKMETEIYPLIRDISQEKQVELPILLLVIRIAARKVFALEKMSPTPQTGLLSSYSDVTSLYAHRDQFSEEWTDDIQGSFRALTQRIEEMYGSDHWMLNHVTVDELVTIARVVNVNAHGINGASGHNVGDVAVGLFPKVSLCNHSCFPNCVFLKKGTELHLRTISPVKENEELLVHYIDIYQVSSERKKELKKTKFFDCNCTRCQSGAGDAEIGGVQGKDGPEIYQKCHDLYVKGRELYEAGRSRPARETLERLLTEADGTLLPTHVLLFNTYPMLFNLARSQGDLIAAVNYCRRILSCFRSGLVPENYVERGNFLFALAETLKHLLEGEKVNQVVAKRYRKEMNDAWRTCYWIRKVNYGEDHPVTKEVVQEVPWVVKNQKKMK